LARRGGSGEEKPLQNGEKLVAGDMVAFDFTVSPAAHVYLVQRTRATGALRVLFPNPDITSVGNPLPAGARVRIPGPDQAFEVDNEDLGLENVYVIASPRALPRLHDALARLEGEIALNTLFRRFPSLRLEGSPDDLRWREVPLFHSLERLPVCWDVPGQLAEP
jgi:hypothetical protein